MEQIEGRTALVTGGASGIGLGIAEALIDAGAHVVIADRDTAALERQSARLGDALTAIELDVTDREAWASARTQVEATRGPVSILVNNAGVGPDLSELADMDFGVFDRLVTIKLFGTFNGIHTFAAAMRDAGEGHIVNTASMAGVSAMPRLGAYTASKFGVVGMSEVLRLELAPHGVGVSVLCPGLVKTNLAANSPDGPAKAGSMDGGIDPRVVGDQVVDAIRADDLYIFTHGEHRSMVEARCTAILAAFDTAPDRSGRTS